MFCDCTWNMLAWILVPVNYRELNSVSKTEVCLQEEQMKALNTHHRVDKGDPNTCEMDKNPDISLTWVSWIVVQ